MGVVPIPMQQFWRFLFQRNLIFFFLKIRRDLFQRNTLYNIYIYIYLSLSFSFSFSSVSVSLSLSRSLSCLTHFPPLLLILFLPFPPSSHGRAKQVPFCQIGALTRKRCFFLTRHGFVGRLLTCIISNGSWCPNTTKQSIGEHFGLCLSKTSFSPKRERIRKGLSLFL